MIKIGDFLCSGGRFSQAWSHIYIKCICMYVCVYIYIYIFITYNVISNLNCVELVYIASYV